MPRCAGTRQNVPVVSGADRIIRLKQASRIRGSISEEIDQNQAAEVPFPSEPDAPSNRGVILLFIRGGWIQADEHYARELRIPDSGKGIAECAALGKSSGAMHWTSPHRP